MEIRTCERREDIPDSPPSGMYVIVDVLNFSTTVTDLLDQGVRSVYVRSTGDEVIDCLESLPDNSIGGAELEFAKERGLPLHNSPTHVAEYGGDLSDRPTVLSSANGARCVGAVKDYASELVIGSTINARSVGKLIRDRRPSTVVLVAAGHDAKPGVEDLLGCKLIIDAANGRSMSDFDTTMYDQLLEESQWLRRNKGQLPLAEKDVELAKRYNESTTVPRFDGERFVPR